MSNRKKTTKQQDANTSKLDELAKAEEQIVEETETTEADKVEADTKTAKKQKAEPAKTDTKTPTTKTGDGTDANVDPENDNVDDGSENKAVETQYDSSQSDEQVARTAEMQQREEAEKANSLPDQKTAPERISNKVKTAHEISRAKTFNMDKNPRYTKGAQPTGEDTSSDGVVARQARHNPDKFLGAGNPSQSSTNHLQVNEVAVPAEDHKQTAKSELQMKVERQMGMSQDTLQNRTRSNEPIVSRRRRVNIFQALAEGNEADSGDVNKGSMTSDEMRKHLVEKTNVSEKAIQEGTYLGSLVETLTLYSKNMGPNTPTTPKEITRNQTNFVNVLKTILEQKQTEVGVVGLNIVEEFFRKFSNGAFSGERPFRAFNEFSTKDNRLTNLIYTIQEIATHGREKALANVSITKLKESVESESGQRVIVSYLNQ